MAPFPDIFDALDISTRENSYTRLIGTALSRHPDVCRRFIEERLDQVVVAEPMVRVQHSIGKGNLADLVIDVETTAGAWRVVVENKVLAGGDHHQLERYLGDCRRARDAGEIVGYHLINLALSAVMTHEEWCPLSYGEFVLRAEVADPEGALLADPLVGQAWRALADRARHFARHRPPPDEEPMIIWLRRQDEGFVTLSHRAHLLGRSLVPRDTGLAVNGFDLVLLGREQILFQIWRPSWDTSVNATSRAVEENVSVHFEVDIPWPHGGEAVTCHLHCETMPYRKRKDLDGLGAAADKYKAFVSSFSASLHAGLAGTGWSPSRRYLQKARISVPLAEGTTVGEFRRDLLTRLDRVADVVDRAMLEAGRSQGLGWAAR